MRKHSQLLLCAVLLFLTVYHGALVNGADRQPNKVAQSDNFVVTAPTQELATAIVEQSEKLRAQIAREWLNKPLPIGIGEAVIIARLSDDRDSGRTWPAMDPTRPTMVWLTSSADDLTGALLAHELTHVVLSSRFPRQLPPWANEGIASATTHN